MTEQTTAPAKYVTHNAIKLPLFWTENPTLWLLSCRVCLPKWSNHSILHQFRSCGAKTPSENLHHRPDYELSVLVQHSKAKLVSSYTLSHWQWVSKVIHHPTAQMDDMLALLPEVCFWVFFRKGYLWRWETTW